MEDERYARQAQLPEVGEEGQRLLADKRVLIVGMGGLGCVTAAYLAMAGVGQARLADGDRVDTPDLGRQFLYGPGDCGRMKVEVAAQRLRAQNPTIHVQSVPTFVERANLAALLEGVDLVVDGTDLLAPRRLLNRAATTSGIPVIFGGASGFNGYVLVCIPGSACFECVWQEPPGRSCEEAGVLGPLLATVGGVQACEAIKLLLGIGQTLMGRLLLVDALRAEHRVVRVRRRDGCPACGK